MEILWKVFWISCLLFSTRHFRALAEEEANATSASTPKAEVKEEEEEKSQGDLDLETQDQVAILKQINRVNDDGSYTFGYEAADGSFKIETRDVNGNVKGMFGFVNEEGELKRVSYSASNGTGFQSTGTLNVPPLPGTSLGSNEETDRTFGHNRQILYDQIIRPKFKSNDESSTKIDLLEPTTGTYDSPPEIPSPKLPLYIFGSSTVRNELTSSARPVVIQHIPKVRPTPATSSTTPTESEEILPKPLFKDFAPKRTSNGNFISFGSNEVTSTTTEATEVEDEEEETTRHSSVIQVIRPRTGPYKKVIVTKRPIVTTTPQPVTTTEFQSKEYLEKLKEKELAAEAGNGVRRQLGVTNNFVTPTHPGLLTSGTEDSPDVYGGGGGGHTSRPYPTNAYRALFTQIPQHQRILQNSYIQNQNQYLAAAFGNATPQPVVPPIVPSAVPSVVPSAVPSVVPTTVSPGVTPVVPQVIPPSSVRTYPGAPLTPASPVPQDPNNPPRQNNFIPAPVPQTVSDGQGQRQYGVQPSYVRPQYPPTIPPIVSPYHPMQPYNQIYIPPALLEHIIRMLIAAQQRQRQTPISPFQQAVFATLGPGNVPPELIDNRYDPRYYQSTFPNYPVPNPYPVPMIPRPPYDPQYPMPYYQQPTYVPVDPRYGYQPQMYSPIPYTRFPPRVPYEIDPTRQQQQNDDIVYRMLLGYPRFPPQVPVPTLQNPSNVVERSPVYQPGRDSTTSSTTPSPRVGPVRNVQILGQITEDSERSNNYQEGTKSGE